MTSQSADAKHYLPVVSAIGSCRVHRPLIAAHDMGLIKLETEGLKSYCNNVSEIIQKLRYAQGDIKIPEHLQLFINGTEEDDNFPLPENLNYDNTDIFATEVSTLKRLELEGFAIQQNFFIIYFVRPNRLGKWWRELVATADKHGTARITPRQSHITPEAKAIAAAVTLSICSKEFISQEIKALREYTNNRPLVIVSHFNVPTETGEPIKERVILDKILSEVAAETKSAYFQPAKLISEHGIDIATDSTTHWAKPFYKEVGLHLVKDVILPYLANQEKVPEILSPPPKKREELVA